MQCVHVIVFRTRCCDLSLTHSLPLTHSMFYVQQLYHTIWRCSGSLLLILCDIVSRKPWGISVFIVYLIGSGSVQSCANILLAMTGIRDGSVHASTQSATEISKCLSRSLRSTNNVSLRWGIAERFEGDSQKNAHTLNSKNCIAAVYMALSVLNSNKAWHDGTQNPVEQSIAQFHRFTSFQRMAVGNRHIRHCTRWDQ